MRITTIFLSIICLVPALATAQENETVPSGRQPPGTKVAVRSVPLALDWLARNQLSDGGWSYRSGDESFENPGKDPDRVDATSLALLAFLSTGLDHTHKSQYQETLAKGLAFLQQQAKPGRHGLDLRGKDGTMLGHCRATLALAEASLLSDDKRLQTKALAALKFLEHARNCRTGGWGEQPAGPADMTVTVWAAMIVSPRRSRLEVPYPAVESLQRFLKHVQSDDGAYFGRTASGKDPLATACGLFVYHCQGKTAENPPANDLQSSAAMQRGAEWLMKQGSDPKDCTYNFFLEHIANDYAQPDESQALRRKIRKQLVTSQIREGATAGSWYSADDVQAKRGGRLYQTALNALTLTVWSVYRHRLYQPVKMDDFRGQGK